MTAPRRHLPGQCVMLTRRCFHRKYLLRPDDFINRVVAFETARNSVRHDQSIHAVMAMSNHVHIGATDTTGDRSKFMRDAMREISKARNTNLGRRDSLWDGRPFGNTVLLDRDSIERKLLYIWLNPVKAGLVNRVEDWPGFVILPRHWGRTCRVESPDEYYGRNTPDSVTFTPQPPPGYDEMSLEEVRNHFQELLHQAEEEVRKSRDRGPVAGKIKICRTDPFSSPDNSESAGGKRPRFASRNAELMERAQKRYYQFLDTYERRRQRWVQGRSDINFPAGTVWLARFAPVRCKPPDEEEPGLFEVD